MAFVAGKVRGPDGAKLRAHVDDCQRCNEYVAGQRAIWQLLNEWEPEFASPDFTREVTTRVANLPPQPWFVKAARFVMARPFKPAFSVAAVTAVMAISLYMRNPVAVPAPVSVEYVPHVAAAAVVAPKVISPVEAEQMDKAFDDLQLLHQLDSAGEGAKTAARSM